MHKNADINSSNSLLEYINKNRIKIYGAGFVADFFYRILNELNMLDSIKNFIITKGSRYNKNGLPVIPIDLDELDDSLVCIAVHESRVKEIEKELDDRSIKNYVWIYPFLYDLWLGEPVDRDFLVQVRDIWGVMKKRYEVAIRYVAIEQYYGKNTFGYEMYKKAVILPKDRTTVESRLNGFIHLIQSVNENEFDNNNKIKVFEDNNEIIDGMHRYSIAVFKGMDKVNCDIYRRNNNIQMKREDKILTMENLIRFGFALDEIQVLDKVNAIICARYN